ncbi:MAG: PIN domain-containing protein [Bacteroidales bacterium]|nr:PIN domain-containing protein [Bacteroidales bacterium]
MKIFLDTNIVIDYLTERQPWYVYSLAVIKKIREHNNILCCSSLTYSTAEYILTKLKFPFEIRRKKLNIWNQLCQTTDVDSSIVKQSLESSFNDLEDAIQYFSALNFGADTIITRNKKDFELSDITVLTPEEFLK